MTSLSILVCQRTPPTRMTTVRKLTRTIPAICTTSAEATTTRSVPTTQTWRYGCAIRLVCSGSLLRHGRVLHAALWLLPVMHLGRSIARLLTERSHSAHQAAWVMLVGAVVWGLLQPDRAFVMALYAGISAFYLYRLSWDEPENRPLWLVLAGLLFGASVMLRPTIADYDAAVSLLASFGHEAFRIVCEVAIFYAISVSITILRRSLLARTRFGVPTSRQMP